MTLTECALKHGCDKATRHCYTDHYYNTLFSDREARITLVEIGVYRGESMRMWREWLPNARIIGMDIDLTRCGDIPGVELYQVDAYSPAALDLFDDGSIDVLIDDGSHVVEDQIFVADNYRPKIHRRGEIVMEDIQGGDAKSYLDNVLGEMEVKRTIIDLRHIRGRYDDIIIEIQKP